MTVTHDLHAVRAALRAIADDPGDTAPGHADRMIERLVRDHAAVIHRDEDGARHLACAGLTASTAGGSIRLVLNWRTTAQRLLAEHGVPA